MGTGSFEEAWLIVVVILYIRISSFSPSQLKIFDMREWSGFKK